MDDSGQDPDTTVKRLQEVLQIIWSGLNAGLRIAEQVHQHNKWNAKADLHLYHHLARREAMERLKEINPHLDLDENLGLPMSGLIVRPTSIDILRVWYSEENAMKAPESEVGKEFVTQQPWGEDLFSELNLLPQPAFIVCKTYVRWAAASTVLTRFEIVRPRGLRKGVIVPDWTVDLLPNMPPYDPNSDDDDNDDIIDDGE